MEEVKTYMVDRGSGRYIEMSNKVEKVLNTADVHLLDIVRYFIDDIVDSNSDEEFFEENCKALATYKMILNSRKNIADLIKYLHDRETIELIYLGELIEGLLIIENYVEENSKKLNMIDVDSEKILGKLYGAVSPLQHFLRKYIPTVKQLEVIK